MRNLENFDQQELNNTSEVEGGATLSGKLAFLAAKSSVVRISESSYSHAPVYSAPKVSYSHNPSYAAPSYITPKLSYLLNSYYSNHGSNYGYNTGKGW